MIAYKQHGQSTTNRPTAMHDDGIVSRRRVALVVGWAVLLALVITGELLPGDSKPMKVLSDFDVSDKVLHFSAYAALAIIPTLGLPVRWFAFCIVGTEIVGVLLEFAQRLVPSRTCDPVDILANTVGVLTGMAVALVIRFRIDSR